MNRATIAMLALSILGAAPPPAVSCSATLERAHVLTGQGFEVRDLSFRDGRFVPPDARLPKVDASALWITPPLVDAHTHTINDVADDPKGARADAHRRWLGEGVFYALNPNNIRADGPTPAPRDDQVEYEAASGGLTRPGGHPTQLYPKGMDGRAYHEVTTAAQARAAVARVRANGARFVKLYLLDHKDPGNGDGLSAEAFVAAVAEAKRLGLRPIAHIEDADDFRLAVSAGVFALMHLPYWPPSAPPARPAAKLMIDRADAAAAARAGIIAVPTAILTTAQFDGAALREMMVVERHNLTLLRDAGVRLAVGEDYIGTMHDEIAALRGFAIFDGAEMLRMATQNGAALAFPDRRLGRLAEGYEASFLAYRHDPTKNWFWLREPVAGVRGGRVLIDGEGVLAKACKG